MSLTMSSRMLQSEKIFRRVRFTLCIPLFAHRMSEAQTSLSLKDKSVGFGFESMGHKEGLSPEAQLQLKSKSNRSHVTVTFTGHI